MTNYLNPAFKALAIALLVSISFLSCKKKETSSAEYEKMATAKLNEIKSLSSNIPCNIQAEVSVQEISTGCSSMYYLVKPSDLAQFEKLKKQYLDLTSKTLAALNREGIIVDPCFEAIWMAEQPIRMECSEGKVQLITSQNINLAEATTIAAQLYPEIIAAVNAQTCAAEPGWMYTLLIKDKVFEIDYVPYLRTKDHSALKKKISLYNRLRNRIIIANNPNDIVGNALKVSKIECVNGKPVIKFQ